MVQVYKPVLENPVYCEILIKLGNKKTFVSDFSKEFEENGFIEYKGKERSVLSRQMEYLADPKNFKRKEETMPTYMKDGKPFLLIENPEEKKQYNKKIFYINREKLTEAFIEYILDYLERYNPEKEYQIESKEKDIKEFKIKKEEYASNEFIQNFFIELIYSLRRHEDNRVNLKDFFFGLLDYFMMVDESWNEVYSIMLRHLGLADIEAKGEAVLNDNIIKMFGKDKLKPFKLFQDFLRLSFYPRKEGSLFYKMRLKDTAIHILRQYLGEEKTDKIQEKAFHQELSIYASSEESIKTESIFPRAEEDKKKIKKSDVEGLVKELKDLRKKNYQEEDIKNELIKLLKELKRKFYFLEVPFRINLDDLNEYKKRRDDAGISVLISEIVFYELALSVGWGISISDKDKEDIKDTYMANILYVSKEKYLKEIKDKK